jgi:hypothetical protein
MKRRSKTHGQKMRLQVRINSTRAAFNHALGILKPEKRCITRNKDLRGLATAFEVSMERDDGKSVTAKFGLMQGFRFSLKSPGESGWNRSLTILVPSKSKNRLILPRLAEYRKALIAWQTTASNPLAFRDFNRLLAALSYDPAAKPHDE